MLLWTSNRPLIQKADSFNKYDIPDKLITLTLQNTRAKVKIINEQSASFAINSGVRQRDILSALLFSLVMDQILISLDLRGNISIRLKQTYAYADDRLMLSRTQQALADTLVKLKIEAQKVGLIINAIKIKYMKCSRNPTSQQTIEIGEMEIENVYTFIYLGE
jgi:hypothetical protein